MPWSVSAAVSLVWTGLLGWLLLDAGCRGARRLGIGEPASLRLLAGAILGTAGLWLWLLLLGAFSALGPRSAAVGVVAGFAALRAREPAPGAIPTGRPIALLLGRSRRNRLARIGAWLLAAVFVLVLIEGLRRPVFAFDTLSYHLPFTARVLDTATIPHVDTPFGDPAAAYQPKTEHVLRTVLAPLRGHEQLLWIGAFPHLALLWLGVYVAARALGARRAQALWGAASTLLATVTLSQAADSLVDLSVASWWLAAAACLLAWQRGIDRPRLPLVAGLALGFSFGTKYLAIALAPLLPLLLGPAFVCRRTPRSWAALAAGAIAIGSFFYLRNWVWTGNPLYPLRLEFLGWELLDGAITRADMTAWVFNTSGLDAASLLGRLAEFTGPLVGNARNDDVPRDVLTTATLALIPAGLWLGGTLSALRRPAALCFAALTPASLLLCWFVVPFTYGRFAIIATGAVGVMAALAGRRHPGIVAGVILLGLLAQCALVLDRWHVMLAGAVIVAGAGFLAAARLPAPLRPRAWQAGGNRPAAARGRSKQPPQHHRHGPRSLAEGPGAHRRSPARRTDRLCGQQRPLCAAWQRRTPGRTRAPRRRAGGTIRHPSIPLGSGRARSCHLPEPRLRPRSTGRGCLAPGTPRGRDQYPGGDSDRGSPAGASATRRTRLPGGGRVGPRRRTHARAVTGRRRHAHLHPAAPARASSPVACPTRTPRAGRLCALATQQRTHAPLSARRRRTRTAQIWTDAFAGERDGRSGNRPSTGRETSSRSGAGAHSVMRVLAVAAALPHLTELFHVLRMRRAPRGATL